MISYETLSKFDEMTEEEIIGFLDDTKIDILSLYQYDGNTIVSGKDSEKDIEEIFANSPIFQEHDWKYLFLKLSARLLSQQKLSEMLKEILTERLGEQEANILYANLKTQYQMMTRQLSSPADEKTMAEIDELYDIE